PARPRAEPIQSPVWFRLVRLRLWGVIHLYRPIGRRGKWSRALVRHGANPRMALSTVLGMPAEDIRVKGCAGVDPLLTASPLPTPAHNIPNPNTAEAGTKLEPDVPGSPAGGM